MSTFNFLSNYYISSYSVVLHLDICYKASQSFISLPTTLYLLILSCYTSHNSHSNLFLYRYILYSFSISQHLELWFPLLYIFSLYRVTSWYMLYSFLLNQFLYQYYISSHSVLLDIDIYFISSQSVSIFYFFPFTIYLCILSYYILLYASWYIFYFIYYYYSSSHSIVLHFTSIPLRTEDVSSSHRMRYFYHNFI